MGASACGQRFCVEWPVVYITQAISASELCEHNVPDRVN